MPKYVMISQLTDEGAKTLKNNPKRVKEVNDELEQMGVKVLEQFFVLGDFDFLNIVEAEDESSVSKAAVELASRGSIKTKTYTAIPMHEFTSAFE
ncbi:GYD domain-containing protein [Methanohalobium sp.]|uniref:GYD domain-containing protein n=1 Tax=Methanohalobium sp. TaxID=2837493 RepID=UPI0025E68260|nr:GYD domain-containing protein [Methanohalobium sp.]